MKQRVEAFNQQSKVKNVSKSPSSSNKTRTAGTSTCIGSRATSPNNLDNTAKDPPSQLESVERSSQQPHLPDSFPLCSSVIPVVQEVA